MTSSSLLVAVPGYPLCLQDLAPNLRLMGLAGALLNQEHETSILDLGAISPMAEIYSTRLRVLADEAIRGMGASSSRLGHLRARIQVRLLDRLLCESLLRLSERTAETIAGLRCDFVVVDIGQERAWGLAQSLLMTLRRRRPSLPLFASGPFAEVFHDSVLERCPALDGVLMPDAELAVTEVAARIHAIDQWRFIPNFRHRHQPPESFHREFVQDLDSLAPPACGLETYPALRREEKFLLMPVEEARGAVYSSHARVQECAPPLRLHSAGVIVRRMQETARQTKSNTFHFQNPEAPATLLRSVAAELVARSVGASYSRVSHVECMDISAASAMAASGGQCVGIRVDSGSQRLISDHYGHTFGISTAEEAVRVTIRQGLHTTVQLTYPCPWDEEHTRAETLRFLRRTRPHAVEVMHPHVLPHSRWHAMSSEFGYNRWDRWYSAWMAGDGLARCFSGHIRPPVVFCSGAGRMRDVHATQLELAEAIVRGNLACSVSPAGAMIARTSGYPGREASFSVELDKYLTAGAVDEVASVVVQYNEHASACRQTGYRPFHAAQLAVGN